MRHNRSLHFLLEADRLFRNACVAQNTGHFYDAARQFSSALIFYRRARHISSQIDVLLKLGDVFRQTEALKSARQAYRAALVLTKKIAASKNILQKYQDALMGEALCLRGRGHFLEALTKFESCLANYKITNDTAGKSYVLWAMGTTERFAGQFQKAKFHLKKSLTLYIKQHDDNGTAYALCGLGGTYRMIGSPQDSLVCYRRANAIFKKSNDRFGLAYSFCGQSNALRMQNKITQALPFMKRAERLYRSLKLKSPLGFVLWSQSQAYAFLKQWNLAHRTLRESTSLFRLSHDKRGLLYSALGRAEILFHQNDLNYQRDYKEASVLAARLNLPFEKSHALRILKPKQATKLYRRCVVCSGFFLYRTLP